MDIKKGKYYRFDGPNGFTVKALDNSYDATFRAVVVLQDDYSHVVGHISSAWSNTSFVESDLSEFLEEANKRYPMGSRYVSLGGDPDGIKGRGVSSVEYEAKIWYYNDELRGIDMGNYVVYNFCIDKWAEIINDQVDTEETLIEAEFDLTTDDGRLAYAKKYYPIGTKYKPLSNFGGAEVNSINAEFEPRIWVSARGINNGIEVSKMGLIYHGVTNKWAEIINEEEFDLTTNEGRLAYARKYYPIGTKYISVGESKKLGISDIEPRLWGGAHIECGEGFIYASGRWAEIIKEETNMETQKLSRQGLKEIHSVACATWKTNLENYSKRNTLEDYIELTNIEVNHIFNSCTKEQLPIVSKYLKQDDGSVNLGNFRCEVTDGNGKKVIEKRVSGEYGYTSFWLDSLFNWDIKTDSMGKLCLIPTKKK